MSGHLSASGDYLFVANHALGAIGIIDIDPTSNTYDTAIDTRAVGADPIFMALSADGTDLSSPTTRARR